MSDNINGLAVKSITGKEIASFAPLDMIQCVHRIVDYKCYILENWLCLYVDYPSNDESAAHHRRDVYTRNRRLSLRSTCWFKRCWPYLRQNAFDRTYLLSLALSFWNTIVCAPPRCIHPVFASLSRDKVPNLCEFDLAQLLHPCDLVDVLPFPQMKDDNCSLLPMIFRPRDSSCSKWVVKGFAIKSLLSPKVY